MPCTNCTSERSYLALKKIKTRLKSCITQERLDVLSLLSNENDITTSLNFENVIEEFSQKKAKK